MHRIALLAVFLLPGIAAAQSALSCGPPDLTALVQNSDLIIIAASQNICDASFCEGPIPKGDGLTACYNTYGPELRVSRVLKGPASAGQILPVYYSALTYQKETILTGTLNGSAVHLGKSYKRLSRAELEAMRTDAFGAPHKGTAYIFFLADPNKGEVTSLTGQQDKVVYENFDFTNGMIPLNDATVAAVEKLLAEK